MIDMGFEDIVNEILDCIPTSNLKDLDEDVALQQVSDRWNYVLYLYCRNLAQRQDIVNGESRKCFQLQCHWRLKN